jgi:hypothetical protein
VSLKVTRLGDFLQTHREFQLALVVVLATNIIFNLIWVASTLDGPKDLDSFLHSGAAFGAGLNPYAYHPNLDPQPISTDALNLNPPISIYLFEPLSRVNSDFVEAGFIVVSVLLCTIAVGALLKAYPDKQNLVVILAILSMAGFWHMLWYLQIYAPLILAVTGSWLMMRKGNLLMAGILIGLLVAMKPNYALVPLALLAARHTRVALPAIVTAALISAIPLVLEGPKIYEQWLDLSLSFQGVGWASNASLMSVGERFGAEDLGKSAAVLLVAGVLYALWRWRPALEDATAISLLTVLLFGPVSWAGYTLLLLPYLMSKRWDRMTWFAVLLLDMPFAPQKAGNAIGQGWMDLNLSWPPIAYHINLPNLYLDPVGSFLWPVFNATYAWALILLMATLVVAIIRHAAPGSLENARQAVVGRRRRHRYGLSRPAPEVEASPPRGWSGAVPAAENATNFSSFER